MNGIRLTVGIPSYNRAGYLRVALDSVLAQVKDALCGKLEILISDNASTDATQEVIREYAGRYPGLVISHRNPSNLGFSRNVDAVIRHARGDFVLLLGDDDGLENNALAVLWDILDQHADLGVVFLAEVQYDSELYAPLDTAVDRIGRQGGVLYRPGLEYVRQTRIFPPFLVSGYVVRREAWIKAVSADFCETICVHALTTLRIMVDHAAYMSFSPVIRYRIENKGGNRWHDELYPFTFHLNLLVGCRGIKASYPAKLHRYLHRQAMRSISYHIMELKVSGGRFNVSLLRNRLKELAGQSDPFFWLNCVLLRTPAWMLRVPFRIAVKLWNAAR
jgi:glycosyltransferase involved in cell wall biosynthesis